MISEIFASIDGEVNRFGQGGLTTFIRFAGCSKNCSYCDTKYASKIVPDQYMTIHEIISKIKTQKVTITGGEPLEQRDGFDALMANLLHPLMNRSFNVTVETNGIEKIPFDRFLYAGPRLGWVIDYKLEYRYISPYRNFKNAGAGDWIKIVIDCEQLDYNYQLAIEAFDGFRKLGSKAKFAIGLTDPSCAGRVANWMVKDRIYNIYLNIQIHKLINMQ